jgi:poly(hydroxyalkanoate) depolymerase family esterase
MQVKINEAFLSQMRELTRNLSKSCSLPGAERLKEVLDGATFNPAARPAVNTFSAPGLPDFVTDLLSQLGVTTDNPLARQFSPSPDTDIRSERDVAAEPGQFVTRSYACAAGARTYKLFIPTGYVDKPLPLVMMLHGCNQNPDDFSKGTRANEIANEVSCFVAYPAQTQTANSSKCWNWFQPGDQRAGAGEPAVLAGITQEIMSDFAIDADRVFVAGLSAGGAMAAVLGAEYPTLFAAVGIHSGLPAGAATDLPTALATMRDGGKRLGIRASNITNGVPPPTIVFHGNADKTVHPRNAETIISQCLAGRPTQSVLQEAHSTSGRGYTRTTMFDAQGDSIAELWVIHHAGHAWAGGSSSGSYTDPKGPDATREMMTFFLAHPMSFKAKDQGR